MAKGLDGKKLPKGISQRKNGLYMGRVMYHGESHTLYNRSLTDLKKEMLELRYQLEHGTFVRASKITLDEWFEEWLSTYKAHTVKQGTLDTYRKHYHAYLSPMLGKIRLEDIRAEHLQKLLNGMAEAELSECTIQLCYCILSGIFKQAYKSELIQKNPFALITKPKGTAGKEKICFTKEQQAYYMDYSKKSYLCNLFQLAICTGMRYGEIAGLLWSDVDFKARVIHVRHNLCDRIGGGHEIDTPKTDKSTRDIPMIDRAYEILRNQETIYNDLHGNIRAFENNDFVFSVGNNEPVSRKRVTHEIEVMLSNMKADGIDFPYFTFHSTRHTFATRCAESGMDLQVLKTILGHSSLAMTADLYSHVLPDKKKEAMQNVSAAF